MYYHKMSYSFENKKFFSNRLALEDFIQEANIGLLIAIEKYDYGHPSRATFNTYAHNWIRQRCQRFLRDGAAQIRMPIYRQQKEDYAYSFFSYDDPEKDYARFLRDIKEEYKDETFQYVYDEEYFFSTLRKIINESSVQSPFGYEMLCHKYGVDGYQRMKPLEIAELFDLEVRVVQRTLEKCVKVIKK